MQHSRAGLISGRPSLAGLRIGHALLAAGVAALLAVAALVIPTPRAQAAATAEPGQFFPMRGRVANNVQVAANGSTTVPVAGVAGVPASGVASVFVVLSAKGSWFNFGSLKAYPSGGTAPGTTAMSYNPNVFGGTSGIVKVGADGAIVVANTSAQAVNLYVDVQGYTLTGNASGPASTFVPLPPGRVLNAQNLGPYGAHEVTVNGVAGIPASGVTAVALAVSTLSAADTGTLRVYTAGEIVPVDAALEYQPATYSQNLVLAKPNAAGKIAITNVGFGSTAVSVDVAGYFTDSGSDPARGVITSVAQNRLLNEISIPAGGVHTVALRGQGGIPNSPAVRAASYWLTAKGTGSGTLRAYPSGAAWQGNHTLGYFSDRSTTAHALTQLSASGAVDIRNDGTAAVKIWLDVAAYTGKAPSTPELTLGPLSDESTLSSTTPTLSAASVDPEGAPLNYDFQVAPQGSTNPISVGTANGVAHGSAGAWTVPANVLTSPGAYVFRARATDVSGASSAWTSWHWFGVDAPQTPTDLLTEAGDEAGPVLSGVVSRASERPTTGRFYLFDADGDPVGPSPLGEGTVDGGQRVSLRVPADLIEPGDPYTWQIEACAEFSCAPRTAPQPLTWGEAPPAPALTALTVTGNKITLDTAQTGAAACAGAPCALTPTPGVQLGGSGDGETVTRLRVDLSEVPAGAEIESATLTLSGCSGDCAASRQITAHQIEPLTGPATGSLVAGAAFEDALAQVPANAPTLIFDNVMSDRSRAADPGLLLRSPGTGTVSFTGLSLTVGYLAAEAPGQVSAVSARPGDGGLLASWEVDGNLDAESFQVEVLNSTGGVVKTATTMDTSVIVGGLANGQSYGVRVRATNAAGPGPWLATAANVTTAATPGGAQGFVDAVRQFGDAQLGLVDGTFASVASALTASSQGTLFSAALAVTGDSLLAEKAGLAVAGIERESDTPTVEEALVSYDAATNRVTVRAVLTTRTTDTYTDASYIDPDHVGPAEAETEETITVDYVFTLPAPSGLFSVASSSTPVLSVLKDGDAVDASDASANATITGAPEDNTM
ncbi:fibronectin type III domain-containing protein [Actinocorallia sp. A-T 12471]|uniref:fibronectin type III domain-containing protein n=1 Tax=Actinocorallia sp. A-T 12471 TaxID=3089813 RepID=UPI0029D015A0|nr:fibronectin type III domain-containing protein [Actinocorallia sp. A-T 12471]MDX6739416.1 fibronectin type III domain-containing protein [Actinocorallia sp. A-T 12471]